MALKEVRMRAGYKTARRFTKKVGIPYSSYIRWENDPMHMPLGAAIELADTFCCSIDEIVGHRVLGDMPDESKGFDELYKSLSDGGKARMDEYAAFLRLRENMLLGK